MKFSFCTVSTKMSFGLQAISCLLLGAVGALIFPPYEGNWQGVIAVILFLAFLLAECRRAKELFGLAYWFGFAFYAVSFIWINQALLIDDNKFISYIPVVFLAIGGFFGLFWALPALAMYWGRNIYIRALFFCVAFVLFEWIRSFIFTGFPWNLLGTALAFNPKLIQGAMYVGTYGLSFMLLLFLCGVAIFVVGGWQRRLYPWGLVFIVVPLIFVGWSSREYDKIDLDGLKVRLVQPSIPQTFKWHPALAYKNFRQYIDLSKSESLEGVDIVVWGETATPYYLDRDKEHLEELIDAIPENGFLITGLLRVGLVNGEYVPYNSMFVIDKEGNIKDYYDKVHLVPFGEYLPFREYLPEFMTPVANVVGDLGRGEKYKNIQVSGLPLMGGAICYESIFPKEVLNPLVRPSILIVLANDGWYGVSAGPYQHLVSSQMRAVEEGITVIRSANTGISAVILPTGEIADKIGLNETALVDVRLPKNLTRDTIYGRYGNLIVFGLLFIVFLVSYFLNVLKSVSSKS